MTLGEELTSMPCPNPACTATLEIALEDISPGNTLVCPECSAEIELTGEDVAAAIAELDGAIAALESAGKKS